VSGRHDGGGGREWWWWVVVVVMVAVAVGGCGGGDGDGDGRPRWAVMCAGWTHSTNLLFLPPKPAMMSNLLSWIVSTVGARCTCVRIACKAMMGCVRKRNKGTPEQMKHTRKASGPAEIWSGSTRHSAQCCVKEERRTEGPHRQSLDGFHHVLALVAFV
jgi:hypothetical protein